MLLFFPPVLSLSFVVAVVAAAAAPDDMDKTLEQNSIPDESKEFSRLSIEEDYYYPPIYLYFNDDLTEA